MSTMAEQVIDEETLADRRRYIDDLKEFITSHQNKISSLLQQLSWTPEHFVKRQESVVCPYSSGHVMPPSTLKKHTELCQFTARGCPKDEVDLQLQKGANMSENSIFKPLKLDEETINKIVWAADRGPRKVPSCHADYMVNFNPSERLAIQEHVSQSLKPANDCLNVERDDFLTTDWIKVAKKGGLLEKKPKTKTEMLQELRDMRRRRQTYRAKNVHITRKSYTEIMREVINNQIGILLGGDGEAQGEATPHRQQEDDDREPMDVDQELDRKRRHGEADSDDSRSNRRDDRDRDRRHRRDREERDDRGERRREQRERSRSHSHRRRKRSRDRSRSKTRHRADMDDSLEMEEGSKDSVIEQRDISGQREQSGEIMDAELFGMKVDAGSVDLEEGEMVEPDERSRSHKHKRKHKHKHKHRHRHQRESSRRRESDYSD